MAGTPPRLSIPVLPSPLISQQLFFFVVIFAVLGFEFGPSA
jgi:hypothetical protein